MGVDGATAVGKDWIIQPIRNECAEAAVKWNVPPLVAQILLNRGVSSPAEAKSFLQPQLTDLHPPEALPGVVRAAEMIHQAVGRHDQIVLYGDYDVDGITGVAILWHLLTLAGADVSFYVPHRLEEGYGLNAEALKSLADEGARLVVSVDCGITAVEVARLAAELDVKLIITDHHHPRGEVPQAEVVVHPTVGGMYPNPDICGAGVAFKLAWAVAQRLTGAERVSPEYRAFLLDALPLAALGTVADVVPLLGENRVIARCGLARIRKCPWPGLRALLEVAGLTEGTVDGTDVGFKLAPRINAAGRMGHARLALELLTRADEERAREIALYLDEHNRARQAKEREVAKQAREMVERAGLDGDARRAIVLAAEKWHPGVIGIVAARIVDRYHKPTVLIALEEGVGQGSARSVPHFELHQALEKCGQHLISHGGHAMAAGVKLRTEQVEGFTQAFLAEAGRRLTPRDLRPKLYLDDEVTLAEVTTDVVEALQRMAPFGPGNPAPRLATGVVDLAEAPRVVGSAGNHLQLTIRQGSTYRKAIAFGYGRRANELAEQRQLRLAFEPIINEWQGRRSVELRVIDWKPTTQ